MASVPHDPIFAETQPKRPKKRRQAVSAAGTETEKGQKILETAVIDPTHPRNIWACEADRPGYFH